MHLDRRLIRLPGDIGSLACAAVDAKSCLSKDFVCLDLPALKNGGDRHKMSVLSYEYNVPMCLVEVGKICLDVYP